MNDPSDQRIFALAQALYHNEELECASDEDSVECIHRHTGIDKWFLSRMRAIIDMYKRLGEHGNANGNCIGGNNNNGAYHDNTQLLPKDLLKEAKQIGFSDAQIAKLTNRSVEFIEFFKYYNIFGKT